MKLKLFDWAFLMGGVLVFTLNYLVYNNPPSIVAVAIFGILLFMLSMLNDINELKEFMDDIEVVEDKENEERYVK